MLLTPRPQRFDCALATERRDPAVSGCSHLIPALFRPQTRFDPSPADPDWYERSVTFRFKWWDPAKIPGATDRFDPAQLRDNASAWLESAEPVTLAPIGMG